VKRKVVEDGGGGGGSEPSDLGAKMREKRETKGKKQEGKGHATEIRPSLVPISLTRR
jgi:hypothetical protein